MIIYYYDNNYYDRRAVSTLSCFRNAWRFSAKVLQGGGGYQSGEFKERLGRGKG